MKELLRETFLGKTLRLISARHLLQYPEESSSFTIPNQYASQPLGNPPDTPSDLKALHYGLGTYDESTALKGQDIEMETRTKDLEKRDEGFVIVDCRSALSHWGSGFVLMNVVVW